MLHCILYCDFLRLIMIIPFLDVTIRNIDLKVCNCFRVNNLIFILQELQQYSVPEFSILFKLYQQGVAIFSIWKGLPEISLS